MKATILKEALLLIGCIMIVSSCNYNPQETTNTIKKGKTTIAADESLKPVIDAQIIAYQAHYPEATFDVQYVPELRAINLLLSNSVEVVAATRELEGKELTYFEQNRIPYEPAPMALDAVALIVNKDSDMQSVTVEELRSIFESKSSGKRLVFDNSNSSNLGYMTSRVGATTLEDANIFAANGNAEVFDLVATNRNAIGVVGFNWFSDEDNPRMKSLRQGVRVLKVAENASGTYYLPSTATIRDRKYPLERLIYLHTTQTAWGVAKGFIRFSCSQIGQLVVEKMGLTPYYIIPKRYVMDNKPLKKKKPVKE